MRTCVRIHVCIREFSGSEFGGLEIFLYLCRVNRDVVSATQITLIIHHLKHYNYEQDS